MRVQLLKMWYVDFEEGMVVWCGFGRGNGVDVDVDDFPPRAAHDLKDRISLDDRRSVYC
jgi:hypothetical protein